MQNAITVILLVTLLPCVTSSEAGWRIIGGGAAEPGEFPYFVSLQDGGTHMCGGAIIDENTVITAAHCFKYNKMAETWSVVVGSPDLSGFPKVPEDLRYRVSAIWTHHSYSDGRIGTGDIAVLKTKNKIQFSDTVRAIKMAADTPRKGLLCTVMGYGYTEPMLWEHADYLLKTRMTIQQNKKCSDIYRKPVTEEEHICAGGKSFRGVCNGDSGGPLVCENGGEGLLYGVTSYTRTPCGQYRSPAVFTRVQHFRQWVATKMN